MTGDSQAAHRFGWTEIPPYRRCLMLGTLLIAAGLATIFYVHSILYPACCDARQYVEMARYFESRGLVANAPHADVRTFGYPLFLALVAKLAGLAKVSLAPAVFAVQLALYLGCLVVLSLRLGRSYGPKVAEVVWYGLALNVFLLPYLSLTLTDAFSVILFLLAANVLVGLSTGQKPVSGLRSAVPLGLLVGFAIVVRPANLWFGSLFIVGALLVFHKGRAQGQSRPSSCSSAATFVGAALVAGLVATIPQTSLNWDRARQLSPLPIYDLKSKQIESGLRHIKYSTNMTGTPTGLFYRNPLFPETQLNRGLEWYVREPLRGSATLALRMYGGLDFDYLFPYVYDLHPDYRPLLFIVSQFVMFFGLGGVILLISPRLAKHVLGESAMLQWKAPITGGQTFVPVLVGWAAIHGVSAMENRFALPMVTLLMPVAVATILAFLQVFRSGQTVRGCSILGGLAIWMGLALALTAVLEQSKQLH